MMRGRMSQSVSLLSSRRGFAAVGGGCQITLRTHCIYDGLRCSPSSDEMDDVKG